MQRHLGAPPRAGGRPSANRLGAGLLAALLVTGLIAPAGALAAAGGNRPPTVVADAFTLAENTTVTGNVLDNDSDRDGDPLSVTAFALASPALGTLDILADGSLTFTPALDWNGVTTGTYVAYDGHSTKTGQITFTVTAVNSDPVATGDTVNGTEDTPFTIAAATLLGNDTDADNDTLSISGVSSATGGTAVTNAGDVDFTPSADLCGIGAGGFDYAISDGQGGTASAHVTVDVACVNDPPIASADSFNGTEDADLVLASGDLTGNDTDADNDGLEVDSVGNAVGGAAEVTAGVVTFTPAANLCGAAIASFDYTVTDGVASSATATATIDLACLNDAPSATGDAVGTTEDTALPLADLAANDGDIENDALTVTAATTPAHGTTDVAGGVVTYTPGTDFCGSDSFDYTVSDGNGGSDAGHVDVTVTCLNDAPVAVDDTAAVAQGGGAAEYDVLGNDTDVDGDILTLDSASVSALVGTAGVASGKVQFAPLPAFTGEAVVTYVVSDGNLTATGTLTVTVGPDITAPVVAVPAVAFGTGRVDQSAPLRVTWSATDAGVGVASYDVEASVAGGAFTTFYSGPATSATKYFRFNRSIIFRVRAHDLADNVSGWVLSGTRRIQPYQAPGSTKVGYSGPWTTVRSPRSSGTGYRYTTTRRARALLTFTGRAVLYVAPRNPKSGHVKVYVDGALVGRYSLYRSTAALGRIIARASWSGSGTHTIRIVNDQGGKRTNLDAFIVLR